MATSEGDAETNEGLRESVSDLGSSMKGGIADAASGFNDFAVDLPLVGDGPIASTGAAVGNKAGGTFGSVMSTITGDEEDERMMREVGEAYGRTAAETLGFVLSGSSSKVAKGVSYGAKAIGAAGVAEGIDPSIDEDEGQSAASWEEKTGAWDKLETAVEAEYDDMQEMFRNEKDDLLEQAGGPSGQNLGQGR